MNTKAFWIVLIAVLAIAIAAVALSADRAVAPADTVEETATTTESASDDVTVVTLTDAGFAPATVTVDAGDTVRFVNESSRGMWVGSDDHPTHTDYDGTSTREHCADGKSTNGTFDQCAAIDGGGSWDYMFQKSGTFGYHNHVGAANTGTVIVR
jgi:plastocyanin